jgi:DNA-binding Xre family transcriptional regulator
MNIEKAIKDIMSKRGYTQKFLAEKLGFTTTSGVSEKLRRKEGMRVNTLLKFVNAMECDVVIRSRTSNDEWKVDLE